jgi:uncharacterized membrane protein (DUF106 family)
MQALSDQQHIERLEGRMDRFEGRMDRLEKKMDDGFAELRSEIKEVRSEARADHRTLLSIQLTTIVAMILGFAALFLQHA